MNPSQEAGPGRSQRCGHGLVGRKHKLFNNLVALCVFYDMRALDATVCVEVDFYLWHHQFERSAGCAATA